MKKDFDLESAWKSEALFDSVPNDVFLEGAGAHLSHSLVRPGGLPRVGASKN